MIIMATALLMMTQCKKENETPDDSAEGTVKMMIMAGPGRTDINTATGAITWSAGDKLYVSDGTNWLGSLTLVGEGGTDNGTFTGSVVGIGESQMTCHFFYLGHDNGMTELTGSAAASISMAAQDGTKAGAMKYHLGYGKTAVTVAEGEATGSVTMSTKIAIAHINFTDGTLAYTGSLTMGGMGICNTMTVSPDGIFTGSGDGGITIGKTATGEKYVTLIPTAAADRVDVEFMGDVTGSMTFLAGIHENMFYGMNNAMAVTLTVVHEYVDFGLPSGLLWATCNVGANSPEEYGDYFMWGSIIPNTNDNCCWANYPGNGGNSEYNESVIDSWDASNLTNCVLNPSVDAAAQIWGGSWRIPTTAECEELCNNTRSTWTTLNGVKGYLFTGKNVGYTDKSIFLPAAGSRFGENFNYVGSSGEYWSGSFDSFHPTTAIVMDFVSDNVYPKNYFVRCCGLSVRPVR